MSRNVALQVLRGSKANMPTLADGEFYFTEDTGELFVGFGGGTLRVAQMAVQLSDGTNQLQLAAVDVTGDLQVDVNNFPTQSKGVQGTLALMVQDFKDSGRVVKVYTAAFTAAAAEALVSLTPASDGAAGAASTSFSVTAGKRFRIQALFLSTFNTTAAIHGCQVNLRMSATGAVTTSSPIIGSVAATTAAATVGLAASQAQSYPDGIELSGTMQFGISQVGIALAGQTVVLIGYEY
jgi:hypothetical protein